jgi:hypothetical protein
MQSIHCEKPKMMGGNPECSTPPSTRAVLCLFTSDESTNRDSSPKTYETASRQNVI